MRIALLLGVLLGGVYIGTLLIGQVTESTNARNQAICSIDPSLCTQ